MTARTITALAAAVLLAGGGAVATATSADAAAPPPCYDNTSTYSTPNGSITFESPQDIDDDGFTDLVTGVPAADSGAGAVDIHYDYGQSDPDIPVHPHAQRLQESSFDGVTEAAGDAFGTAGAIMHIDDNCADIAIGAPGADHGRGKVVIGFGSADGIKRAGAVTIQGVAAGDNFGAQIVAVDHDVWIAAPGRSLGATHAGAIYHFRVANGRATYVETLREGAAPVGGHPAADDNFGHTLAYADGVLVAGTPGADVGKATNAGSVTAIRLHTSEKSESDYLALSATTITQDSPGIGGVAESYDHFGQSVAMVSGDVVVVGVPGEDLGKTTDAGMVSVLRYDSQGKVTDLRDLTQDTPGVPGVAEAGDTFGASVAAGGFSIDGGFSGDLNVAVGVPGEDVGSVRDAGVVDTFRLDGINANRKVVPLSTVFGRGAGGHVGGTPAAGDDFGAGLSLSAYSDEQGPDYEYGGEYLVMYAPGTQRGAGAVALANIGDKDSTNVYNLHDSAGYVAGERYGAAVNTNYNGAYAAYD